MYIQAERVTCVDLEMATCHLCPWATASGGSRQSPKEVDFALHSLSTVGCPGVPENTQPTMCHQGKISHALCVACMYAGA